MLQQVDDFVETDNQISPIPSTFPVMASNDTMFYVIYSQSLPFILKSSDTILPQVNSANVTVWTEFLPDDDLREFCVEIRVDQAVVHVTEAVKRGETMDWEELCPMCIYLITLWLPIC